MILEIVYTVVVFLFAISFLVVFHELGHFVAARWCGVPVLRFSVGFGPVLYRRRFGSRETEFALSALPLGGYVAMLDENELPPEVASGLSSELRSKAFNRQPVARRSLIAVAGPAFNLFFAVLAFTAVYIIGPPGLKPNIESVEPGSPAARAGLSMGMTIIAVEGRPVHTWQMAFNQLLNRIVAGASMATLEVGSAATVAHHTVQLPLQSIDVDMLSSGRSLVELLGLGIRPLARIVTVVEESPAMRAGLQTGDQVVAAGEQPVRYWAEFREAVAASPGAGLAIEVLRDGQRLALEVVPTARYGADGVAYGWLGVQGAAPERAREAYPAHLAVVRALQRCVEVVGLTFNVLADVITGNASLKNFSGPIGIAHLSGQAADLGPVVFLQFLGLLSLGLAIFNLLPIPMLDGGHLMYDLIEVLKGSPVSPGFRRRAATVGIAVLLVLFALICYHDVMRLVQ